MQKSAPLATMTSLHENLYDQSRARFPNARPHASAQRSALRNSFFFVRNMLNRVFVAMSFQFLLIWSVIVGLRTVLSIIRALDSVDATHCHSSGLPPSSPFFPPHSLGRYFSLSSSAVLSFRSPPAHRLGRYPPPPSSMIVDGALDPEPTMKERDD